MGNVVGKFYVASVEDRGETEQFDYSKGGTGKMPNIAVRLQAVVESSDPENFEDASFHRSTPQGSIEMVIQNPDAAEHFQTGDRFYVTFQRQRKT